MFLRKKKRLNSLKKWNLEQKMLGKCVCDAYLCNSNGSPTKELVYGAVPSAPFSYPIVWKVILAFTRARAVMEEDGMSCGSNRLLKLSRRMHPVLGDCRMYFKTV